MKIYRHICEVCDKVEDLSSAEGFDAGWDYPPRMGEFGVIGPRTCSGCIISKTLWWRLTCEGLPSEELTDKDRALITRIQNEPASVLVAD